ncbi:DNA repair protein XRCC1-like [Physella acuta]|uniref:DNA repair protein XRCC1-like n=1 Tax=Physella acuta TaxID=109671 RepID=UPI0027DD82D2|nr:DNA repair protein XRCC1-like [Physella acuta]XP_059156975.1 DNA repair protein XRCC1-like [Physella acuta]
MPEIELQHIVSCSSADKNNPAENLLKADGAFKWKCASPGEKSVSCVIQLCKSTKIHSIDIGNEGSAFVEVLVGQATAASDRDFQVLLVASSFMSPLESRNSTNRNAVRMFGPDKLNKETSGQKWDRVKIVCSQPFSKTCQYGLSFIKLHSPPSESKDTAQAKVKKLGAFTIRDSEEDEIKVGSLFASRAHKESSPPPTPKGAAAVRAANKLVQDVIKTTALPLPPAKRQATSPPPESSKAKTIKPEPKKVESTKDPEPKKVESTKDPEPKKVESTKDPEPKKVESTKEPKKEESDGEESEELPARAALKRQSTSLSSVASSVNKPDKGDKAAFKRTSTEPGTPVVKKFHQILEGVVFVLSGFQNPYRGDLRDKALEMGAKYRPDWGRGCTHLICAFTNTPKYQQVSGKGKIVTKSWILDSYKQKKKMPWRKYRLGDAASPPDSSDEEVNTKKNDKTVDTTAKPLGTNAQQKTGTSFVDSGGDTDDEQGRSNERKTSSPGSEASSRQQDVYGCSTDEDDIKDRTSSPDSADSGLPDLPDFFTDKHFFLYGDIEATELRLLTRYIAAYNGEVEDYMNKKVNYVITSKKWDENFNMAKSENPQVIFVKPEWILACHEKGVLLPHQSFGVAP